jgi:flagellar protein FliS
MDAKFSYREAAVRGATGVRLVILLYEQVIQDLGRAIRAIEHNSVELRTHHINHALTVLAHLQGTLNLELGGAIAQNLARFYNTVRAALLEAHARASREILQQQIAHLLEMREAWAGVERAHAGTSQRGPEGTAALRLQNAAADWKG